MKLKVRDSSRRGISRFEVHGDKMEKLAYEEAQKVLTGSVASLAHFSYEARGGGVSFSYMVNGLVPLRRLLAAPLTPGYFGNMVIAIVDMVRACDAEGLFRRSILLSPDHVLVNPADGGLTFVYVPLQGYICPKSDERELLVYLCEHARVSAAEEELRAGVLDVALRMKLSTPSQLLDSLHRKGLGAGDFEFERVSAEPLVVDENPGRGIDFVSRGMVYRGGVGGAGWGGGAGGWGGGAAGWGNGAVGWGGVPGGGAVGGWSWAGSGGVSGGGAGSWGGSGDSSSVGGCHGGDGGQAGPDPDVWNGTVSQSGVVDLNVVPDEPFRLTRRSDGASWELCAGTFTVGREATCSICLDDMVGVSRRHATAYVLDDGTFELEDNDSTNGVRVNGARLEAGVRYVIERGSRIKIGEELFDLT